MTASRRKPKSRHGCFQCKRRSVKCDEKRPQCSNCENRRDICRYATPGPWLWTNNGTSGGATAAEPERILLERDGALEFHPSPPETLRAGHEASTSMSQFNIPHLRLLLNWTTSTCHTISRNHADSRVWQTVIPEKALSCPHLMHGIFAVSALHLAITSECHDNERQILVEAAEQHQSEAIKMFTKIGVYVEPPDPNVSFALSSLLIGFAFGFPLAMTSQHQTKANSLDELVEIFMLSRKMIKFATPSMDKVHTSEIGGLLLVEEVQSSLSSSSRVVINALHELLNTVYSPTHELYQVFADTIACLEKLYMELDGTGDIVSRAFMWICDVPETFILSPDFESVCIGDHSTLLCSPASAEKVLVGCIMGGARDECHCHDFEPGMETFCSLGSRYSERATLREARGRKRPPLFVTMSTADSLYTIVDAEIFTLIHPLVYEI